MVDRIGFEFFHKDKYWCVVEADDATGEHAPYWWCEDIDRSRVSFPDVILAHEQYIRDVAGFTPPTLLLYPQPVPAAPAQPAPATDAANDDEDRAERDNELTNKILTLLGVDFADWSSSLSGVYAAIRCNMQIGEPQMNKIENWTDAAEISEDTLTAVMFKLTARAERAEGEAKRLRDLSSRLAALLGKCHDKLLDDPYEKEFLVGVVDLLNEEYEASKSEGGAG